MLDRFNRLFGIADSVDVERARFVRRINQSIFSRIEKLPSYKDTFEVVCYLARENRRTGLGQQIGITSVTTCLFHRCVLSRVMISCKRSKY